PGPISPKAGRSWRWWLAGEAPVQPAPRRAEAAGRARTRRRPRGRAGPHQGGRDVQALSPSRSGVFFAGLAGIAHRSARQGRRWRVPDSPNPLLQSGGFGRRPNPGLTWPVLAPGLMVMAVAGLVLTAPLPTYWPISLWFPAISMVPSLSPAAP